MTILTLALLIAVGCCCQLELEAEYATQGRNMYRSQASNGITVYLRRSGQYIEIPFNTGHSCQLLVNNVRHSNDGGRDTVSLYIDTKGMIGFFNTQTMSGNGYLWNRMLNSGQVGGMVFITAGNHIIKILANYTDKYGVEIDKVILDLHCTNTTVNNSTCSNTTASPFHQMEGSTTITDGFCALNLDAEFNASYGGQVKLRSQAFNGKTILLKRKGQHVKVGFFTSSTCQVKVHNVIYSNDGKSDTLYVSIDGSYVGSLFTRGRTGNGRLWNDMLNSGPVGNIVSITAGNHTVKLLVQSTDRWGVELDKVTIYLNCTLFTVENDSADKECPSSVATNLTVYDEDNTGNSALIFVSASWIQKSNIAIITTSLATFTILLFCSSISKDYSI